MINGNYKDLPVTSSIKIGLNDKPVRRGVGNNNLQTRANSTILFTQI